jgi:hypothetical protein
MFWLALGLLFSPMVHFGKQWGLLGIIFVFVARDTRDDISDEDKSKFFLQVKKHRRKGQLASAVLDFRAGEFFDIAPHLTPEFWQP